MNSTKKTLYIIGITMIFAGTLLAYFKGYSDSESIFIAVYCLLFLGWIILFMQITNANGTIVDAPKIHFKDDKLKCFQQGMAKLFAYVTLVAIILGNVFYLLHLSNERKNEILQNGPTQITVADITAIEAHQGKSGMIYHAVFQYKAGGQYINYAWNEEKGDFQAGQKYEIKYAVEYPDMFKIVRLLPQ